MAHLVLHGLTHYRTYPAGVYVVPYCCDVPCIVLAICMTVFCWSNFRNFKMDYPSVSGFLTVELF